MINVIKRTGEKQEFSEHKIKQSIMNAAEDAGLSPEKMKQVTEEVFEKIINLLKNKGEVTTDFIREKILEELGRKEMAVVEAWKKYETTKRK